MRILGFFGFFTLPAPGGLGHLESDFPFLLDEDLMLCGGPVFQAAMRPLLVVVAPPSFDLFLSTIQA